MPVDRSERDPGRDAEPPPRATAAAALLVLAGLAAAAVLAVAPPAARPADAAPEVFSAARATAHLAQIAQRPHPVGTPDHARVRDYIAGAARGLGAEVSVESGEAVRTDDGGPFPTATVHNVLALVPGSAPQTSGGKALLVVAHYDSVPTGPGAADDGAGVAAMLETMRAVRAGGGVRNDVLFLFTDGEELGLLGATLFVARHGIDGIGAVLNWEARGSRGPVWTFQTGSGNHPVVRAMAAANPRPVASSLTDEVYRRLPNDTDFTVFRQAGATGLNSAFIDGVHDYHAASDIPERVDAGSVQHHGESMLGLVRRLGDTDLGTLRGADAVYFDLFARVLVHYPAALAVPLALLGVLAIAVLVGYGVRRGSVRPAGVAVSAAAGLGAVLAAGLVSFALWRLAVLARPNLAALPLHQPYQPGAFAIGFVLVTIAALLAAAVLLPRRTAAEQLAGVLSVLGLLLAACAFALPAASYLLQWPLVAGLPALWLAARSATPWPPGRAWPLVAALAPAVAVVLFAPLLDNLVVAIGVRQAAVVAAAAALGGLVLLPLLAGVLPRRSGLPPRSWLPRRSATGRRAGRLAVPLTVLLVAVAVLGLGVADAGVAPREPRPDALVYFSDQARGTSMWLTGDARPDGWTAAALGEDPERAEAAGYLPQFAGRRLLTAPAPAVALEPPTVRLLADTTSTGVRTVRFRAASERGAWQLQVRLPVQPLRACTVAGRRIEAAALATNADRTGGVLFRHFGAGAGVELQCEVDAGARLPVEVSDHTVGLPDDIAALVGPRPDTAVPVSHGVGPSDSSVARQLVTL